MTHGGTTLEASLIAFCCFTLVKSQFSHEFLGRTEADDGTLLWFDGEKPDNITSWEWETHGATGRTWHWAGDNGTKWTTWVWTSTGPEDNHGGGFLLSSALEEVRIPGGKFEKQEDKSDECNPCCGAAWALSGPVLTWTTPPESSNFLNFSNWMMQQGSHCWGFTSKPVGWGFVFENVTVDGKKGGPGDGACAFPPVSFDKPGGHKHGIPPVSGFGGFGGLGGIGFGSVPGMIGPLGGFGFHGLKHWGGFSGFSHGFGTGFMGFGGLGGCPYSGMLWRRRRRRRRQTESFDDTTEDVDENTTKKPGWAIKRWLARARDFVISIAQAAQEDDGKGGWTIPLGNGYIQVGPNLLRKVSGWIGGAVLTVLGGNPVDPETQVAIETILLDPFVIEAVHNATEEAASSTDAG